MQLCRATKVASFILENHMLAHCGQLVERKRTVLIVMRLVMQSFKVCRCLLDDVVIILNRRKYVASGMCK